MEGRQSDCKHVSRIKLATCSDLSYDHDVDSSPREGSRLHTMAIVFPPLQRRLDWKARIEVATAVLSPTAEELDDILKAAGRRAERLKDELAG